MKTKILMLLLILFLTIGFAVAADVSNLNVPDGWKAIGGGTYHQEGISAGSGNGHNMMIQEWYDGLKEEYYQNITSEQYVVMKNDDGTYMYSDGLNENAGTFEVVEIDGEKYFVNFWTVDDMNSEEIAKTHRFMLEFNKLNNFKPVEV